MRVVLPNRSFRYSLIGLAVAISAYTPLLANTIPSGTQLVDVTIWPQEVTLSEPWQVAQILITGQLDTGEQIDLTRVAELTTSSKIVTIDQQRRIAAVGNGTTRLKFDVEGYHGTLEIPVSVTGMSRRHSVSFVRDVAPALSKMGCNAGTCHGAKDGQGGFKLSLRGYDFLYDHRALTDDIAARRFNRANPEQSLMLLKASGSIPHVGGRLTEPGDRYYQLLETWIADGAKLDLDAPRVTDIRLVPNNPILPRASMAQQMAVIATYSDGSQRDVTAEAFIESGDIEILKVDDRGTVVALRRGEAPLLARYEGAYTATTFTIMGDRSGFVWNDPPTYNYVDQLVYDKLQRVKVQPSELCTDAEFLRRVTLDLTGLPPTADQVRHFLADTAPSRDKRQRLVDHLIGSAAFVEHWTNKWADLLQVNRKFLGEIGATALRNWIQESVAANKPYDQFAYELLTASGSTLENPAAGYWKVLREPSAAMENTTHLFLGVRFNCNKCHDHPFERWTQDQYYRMTAFFAQVDRKPDPQFSGQKIGGTAVEKATPLVEIVYDSNQGETTHDRTGQVTAPKFPYHDGVEGLQGPRREQLATWITSPKNRYFASSYVNRLWGYLLGVGLIEPIDDIRAGNPPTNPQLLDALTEDFVNSGFDVQHMFRTICNSRTYQHSVRTNKWNEDDDVNYSHAIPRRLPAEVLFDTIHRVVGTEPNIPGVPAGLRAAQLPDAGVSLPFLDEFGRPPRESACECERTSGIVLGPIMKLVNGPTINDALARADSELARLAREMQDDEALIEEVFLRVLARHPTEKEVRLGVETLQSAKQDVELAQQQYQQYRSQRLAGFNQWLNTLSPPADWQVAKPESATAQHAQLAVESDHAIVASGPLKQDTYQVAWQLSDSLSQLHGLRLKVLPDESLPSGGPGRAGNGNLVLNELRLEIKTETGAWKKIPLAKASASFSQSGWDVDGAIDDDPQTGWAISPQAGKAHSATFATDGATSVQAGDRLRVTLVQQFQDGKHNIGRFRLAVTDSQPPFGGSKLPKPIQKIARLDAKSWSDAQEQAIQEYYLGLDPELQRLRQVWKTSSEQAEQHRLTGVQDLAWALMNTPAFLFNR